LFIGIPDSINDFLSVHSQPVVASSSMVVSPPFNIVLVEPEIPPNTGSIARLCGATHAVLHLVHPLGFSTTDKHLKRAGLDYWQYVNIVYWESFDNFLRAQDERKLYFFTTKVARPYTAAVFSPGDFLIFGKETQGLPPEILEFYSDRCYTLPMANPHIRSLNLAMTAGIVLYEALRQNT
jgi:tRNA (cytidine/uridine-2'-O-)-methyltransferase